MAQKTDTDLIAATLAETVALHERFRKGTLQAVADAASVIIETLGRGGKLLLFGNGGSAADAQHAAAELVGRFEIDRAGLAAMALACDVSVMTSIANDEGYERVFARQIEALGRKGDVAFGISTSGLSPNVIQGLETAKARGLRTIALTGHDGGHAGKVADIHINVHSDSTARVQEVHRTVIHVICDLVERSIVQR